MMAACMAYVMLNLQFNGKGNCSFLQQMHKQQIGCQNWKKILEPRLLKTRECGMSADGLRESDENSRLNGYRRAGTIRIYHQILQVVL